MFGVLIFDTLPGLFIGIAISMALLALPVVGALRRGARAAAGPGFRYGGPEPPRRQSPSTPAVPVLRIEAGLFFANADPVARGRALPRPPARACGPSSSTPRRSRSSTSRRRRCSKSWPTSSTRAGVVLAMAQNVGQVRDFLEQTRVGTKLRFFDTIHEAVTALTPPGP